MNRSSLLQQEGEASWKPLDQFPEFAELISAPAPTPVSAPTGPSPVAVSVPVSPGVSGVAANPEDAARRLKAPAIFILILAAIGAVFSVGGLFMRGAIFEWVLNAGFPLDPNVRTQLEQMRSAGIGAMDIFQSVLGVAINILVIVGAMKMQRLENWGLAMTSAILIMLPCAGCCCLIGLPVGIWAVITLNKPEIKSAFR